MLLIVLWPTSREPRSAASKRRSASLSLYFWSVFSNGGFFMSKPKKIAASVGIASGHATAQAMSGAVTRPPDDHPVYSFIGRVTSDWSHFESQLDGIIGLLAKTDAPVTACLTGQYTGAHPRLNAIIALLTVRGSAQPHLKKQIGKWNRLSPKFQQLGERRNRIVHDPWLMDMETQEPAQHIRMPKSNRRYEIAARDYQRIKGTIADLKSLAEEVRSLRHALIVALEASHRRQLRAPVPTRR